MTDAHFGTVGGVIEGSEENSGGGWLPGLVWVAGLLSTLYLVGWAGFLSLLSISFINYSNQDFEWWKVASVVTDSMPLLCFITIGIAGLRSWPHGRFRRWGLAAIAFQVAMAIWCMANPEAMLDFTRWPF